MKTTLLIDFNNLFMRNFFISDVYNGNNPDYDFLKYLLFEQIYWTYIKLNKENPISDIVLCIDDKNSWRKVVFSRYKENRQIQREKSDVDWEEVYKQYEKIQKEFKENLPFKLLHVSRCEADDLIGILCLHKKDQNFIISSNDKDFKQLLNLKNVKLYNPSDKEFVVCKNVKDFLIRSIMKGQQKDFILNIKTPEDYPNELRKPGLGDKTIDKILNEGLDEFLDKEIKIKKDGYKKTFKPKDRYETNKKLIDFNYIPKILIDSVVSNYNKYKLKDNYDFKRYFEENSWRSFLEKWEITENILNKLNEDK